MPSQFTLYQSNSLHKLAAQFAETQTRPRSNPLQAESVILQTPGMETWLTQQCAIQNGIIAGVEYIRPAKFLLRLNAILTGYSEERTVFEPENMRWFIFQEIEQNPRRYPLIQEYLQESDSSMRQQKLFTFACETAELFDSYILYRPEILKEWEAGSTAVKPDGTDLFTGQNRQHELWQKQLWNAILTYHKESENTGYNPVEVLYNLGKILENPTPSEKLMNWSRTIPAIALFGMSVLPPRYMELFKLLSLHCPVELYLFNPSQFYWGDLLTDRHVAHRKRHLSPGVHESEYLQMGNTLLRNLGSAGRDFFHSLYETAPSVSVHEVELFSEPEQTTLLKAVQSDILTWDDTDRDEPLEIEKDSSITINRCYTPLREVEVLYDYLLDRFEQDSSLSLGDILIITPDLETYAPLITMVFNRNSTLKGTIADRSVLQEKSDFQKIVELLSLPESRFEAPLLLSLFEEYSDMIGTPLTIVEKEKLTKWIAESGIRWGVDSSFWKRRVGTEQTAPSASDLDLPHAERFTWESGFERMFQGYAAGSSEIDVPSYDEIEGGDAELLGRLASFVHTVSRLERFTKKPRSVQEWSDMLTGWFRELFLYNEGEHEDGSQPILSELIKKLHELPEQVAIVTAENKASSLSFGTIRSALKALLDTTEQNGNFLRGSISFASTMPLRSIPFKVIGMIGMNYSVFPRIVHPRSFDLMHAEPRRGDRNMRQNDLYLFLETVICAESSLYISATAYDEKTGTAQPVSSAVQQFLDYLQENYHFTTENGSEPVTKSLCKTQPLHPFSSRYYNDPNYFTYQKKWFPETLPQTLFQSDLFSWDPNKNVEKVTYRDLQRWLSDPLKDLFEICADMSFSEDELLLDDSEPFSLDNLSKYFLKQAKLDSHIDKSESYSTVLKSLYFNGDLPSGAALHQSVLKASEEAESIVKRLPSPETLSPLDPLVVEGEIAGVHYLLESEPLWQTESETIKITAGKADYKSKLKEVRNLKRLFSLYLNWLILNCHEPRTTRMISLDSTIWFSPIESDRAQEILQSLMKLYIKSRSEVVPYYGAISQEILSKGNSAYSLFESRTENNSFYAQGDIYESIFFSLTKDSLDQYEEASRGVAEEIFGPIRELIQGGK